MTDTLMARLLLANKLATKKQIKEYQTLVTPTMDIGAVLVDQGILSENAYNKAKNHLAKMRSKTESEKTAKPDQQTEQDDAQDSPGAAPPAADEPSVESGAPEGLQVPQPDPAPISPQDSKKVVPEGEKSKKTKPQPVELDAPCGLPKDFIGISGRGDLAIPIPQRISPQNSLDEMLLFARDQEASDLHLIPNLPIALTRFGTLGPVSQQSLTDADTRQLIEKGVQAEQLEAFQASGDYGFVYAIPGGGRYRVTLMKTRDGWNLTARVIPLTIRTLDRSDLPESCLDLANLREGLVLITGAIGCGKTSTMATLVNHINHTRAAHIVTIEDLIEVVYETARCQVTQREIGLHSCSARDALNGALRQDPDVLVISELPDLDAIKVALSAAETGHLVFSTMNTTSASRTIYRLIDSFPPDEQSIIRNRLAQALRGVLSMHLIPKLDGSGLVPAYEVLVISQAITNLIRKGNTHLIGSAMLTGKAGGMVLLDDSLQALVAKGLISGEEAFHRSINKKLFKKFAPSSHHADVDSTLSSGS